MTSRILAPISAAVLTFALVTPAAALEGPGRALKASNSVKLTANTERSSTNSFFPIPLKSFIVPYAGTVRVKWQLKTSDATKAAKLSVISGIETCLAETTQTSYTAGQCDIRVAAGGLLQVGVQATDPATGFVRAVRVFYDLVDSDGLGIVQQN